MERWIIAGCSIRKSRVSTATPARRAVRTRRRSSAAREECPCARSRRAADDVPYREWSGSRRRTGPKRPRAGTKGASSSSSKYHLLTTKVCTPAKRSRTRAASGRAHVDPPREPDAAMEIAPPTTRPSHPRRRSAPFVEARVREGRLRNLSSHQSRPARRGSRHDHDSASGPSRPSSARRAPRCRALARGSPRRCPGLAGHRFTGSPSAMSPPLSSRAYGTRRRGRREHHPEHVERRDAAPGWPKTAEHGVPPPPLIVNARIVLREEARGEREDPQRRAPIVKVMTSGTASRAGSRPSGPCLDAAIARSRSRPP